MSLQIDCQPRPTDLNPRALRRQGQIPAVLYGHNGTEAVSLVIDAKAAQTLLKKAKVGETPVQLALPNGWSGQVVIQEVHKHPWKGSVYHLSFWAKSA